jgi:KRAB domain-containing zinc finger protein
VNRHISQLHGALGHKFKCLVCSKFYPSPKSLKRHLETVHTSVKEFQCPDCLATYKTQQSLSIHMRLHNTVDNCYPCQQCTKTFQSETGLNKHIKISHKHELEICQVCFKTFVTADGLFEHSFVHKGFDPFLCPKSDCPYTVKGKECFANHLIVHHGIVYDEKIYGYKVTDEDRHREQFLAKVQLLTLKRKYECHLCENKRFHTKTTLLQHMQYKHLGAGN